MLKVQLPNSIKLTGLLLSSNAIFHSFLSTIALFSLQSLFSSPFAEKSVVLSPHKFYCSTSDTITHAVRPKRNVMRNGRRCSVATTPEWSGALFWNPNIFATARMKSCA